MVNIITSRDKFVQVSSACVEALVQKRICMSDVANDGQSTSAVVTHTSPARPRQTENTGKFSKSSRLISAMKARSTSNVAF